MADDVDCVEESTFFLWMRIIVGSLSGLVGFAQALDDFHDFAWLTPFALAFLFLLWRQRRPGESRRVYFTNLRAVFTNLSATAIVVSGAWWLLRHIK